MAASIQILMVQRTHKQKIVFYKNKKYRIAEISCPKYFPGASSINFSRGIKHGVGCVLTAFLYRLTKMKMMNSKVFLKN